MATPRSKSTAWVFLFGSLCIAASAFADPIKLPACWEGALKAPDGYPLAGQTYVVRHPLDEDAFAKDCKKSLVLVAEHRKRLTIQASQLIGTRGSVEVLDDLLKRGAHTNGLPNSEPLLIQAAKQAYDSADRNQSVAYAEVLLAHHARVDVVNHSQTALHIAANACDPALTSVLLLKNADPDFSPPSWRIHYDAKYVAKLASTSFGQGSKQADCRMTRERLNLSSDERFYQRWAHSFGRGWANVKMVGSAAGRAIGGGVSAIVYKMASGSGPVSERDVIHADQAADRAAQGR